MNRLIAAVDRRRGIAKRNCIPWFIPEDEKYFTDQTKTFGGHNLIGKTTFLTFKHGPLAGRHNYILTHTDEPITGVTLVHDVAGFLDDFQKTGRDLWVVGGAAVFETVMNLGRADELYLTHVDADFGCDRFFPAYENDYELIEQGESREQNGFRFYYARYVKKAA